MKSYVITQTSELPHQQRVIEEANELGVKLKALEIFIIENPIFTSLKEDEQFLLENQANIMGQYFQILKDRISKF